MPLQVGDYKLAFEVRTVDMRLSKYGWQVI